MPVPTTHPRQGKGGRPYKSTDGAGLNPGDGSHLPQGKARRHIVAAGSYSSMIPTWEEFEHADFIDANNLREMGEGLIGQWPELQFLSEFSIKYLWKESGGKKSGAPVLGKCVLTSGLVEFFAGSDWVVWLGADHCRALEFQDAQIEAALYHELLHCDVSDDRERKPMLRGHDFEGFSREIERYGFWEESMVLAKQAVQGRLALGSQP